MDIQPNKKENIIDKINGIEVSDPYRWLEDSSNGEVKEWIKNQNARTYATLRGNHFDVFSKELAKNLKIVSFSNPSFVKGRYFYTERQPDEDQGVLYVKDGLDSKPKKIFDPNGKKEGNTMSIDYWQESSTGKYIVYGISEGGDEMATIHIKDVDKDQELAEQIIRCRYSQIRWLPDDSAFFYTRNPRPNTVPKNEEHLHSKIYLHKLGENPDNDQLIFGAGRPKDDMLTIKISQDGKYLGIQVSQKWTENDVYIYDSETKETKTLIKGVPSLFSIRFLKDKVLLDTDYKANNYKVLFTTYDDLYKPFDQWKEFIAERKYPIKGIAVTKSKIIIEYMVNVCSEMVIFDYSGKEIEKIPLPTCSSLMGISTRRGEEEFFYSIDSFVSPKIMYRYDPSTSKYSEYRKIDNPINPDDYVVKQEWYTSKDGAKVPMFIFHKKDIELNGLNPAILYGYGGFGIIRTPMFMRNYVPWLERGGVFAIANIRGGGEFGEQWHKDGIKEKKQNSFDDFIAAGEFLISNKYTDKEHLGALGGSNGGLLVSVVGVQRPDLFKAICSQVPLTDMVRFPKFGMAVRWTNEYGNPDIKDDLVRILTWSPYHNVKKGVVYPNFLFTTADKDTRVDPLHARKMAAILQNTNQTNGTLILTDIEAGHGAGKPIVKIVESQALVLSFFSQKLGLKIR